MQTIQIRRSAGEPWLAAALLSAEQPHLVEVRLDGEELEVAWENIHPADQVLLLVEQQARQRYAWVPPEDRA